MPRKKRMSIRCFRLPDSMWEQIKAEAERKKKSAGYVVRTELDRFRVRVSKS